MKRFLSILLCLVLAIGLIAVPAEAKKKTKTKKNKTKTETTFNAKTAKKNIEATYTRTGEGVLAVYTNNNKYAVSFEAALKLTDAAGGTLSEESVKNLCFGKKKTMAYFFKAPVDENNKLVSFADFSGSFTVEEATRQDYTGKIKITTDIQPTSCHCTAMNATPADLTSIFATFVFYDEAGSIITVRNQFINCTAASTVTELSIDYAGLPQPASVKVYKNWAY